MLTRCKNEKINALDTVLETQQLYGITYFASVCSWRKLDGYQYNRLLRNVIITDQELVQ